MTKTSFKNPDPQTSSSLDNSIRRKQEEVQEDEKSVKTKTCEYDKAGMKWASREGVSLGLGPKGSPQHQMQDTGLNSLFDADLELTPFAPRSRKLRLETRRSWTPVQRSRCSTFSGNMGED